MNAKDLQWQFDLLDCKVNVVKTGHDSYVRGFIVDPRGVSIGRATIHCGELSHIKWYWREYGDLVESDFIMTQWRYLQHCGRVLSRNQYDAIVTTAEQLQKEDYDSKVEHRKTLKVKKRKSIQGKNIRSFIKFPRKAPWCDFNDMPILEGDTIVHPVSDERGVVVFKEGSDPADQWLVKYDDCELRLCLQIGDKGQAVVLC